MQDEVSGGMERGAQRPLSPVRSSVEEGLAVDLRYLGCLSTRSPLVGLNARGIVMRSTQKMRSELVGKVRKDRPAKECKAWGGRLQRRPTPVCVALGSHSPIFLRCVSSSWGGSGWGGGKWGGRFKRAESPIERWYVRIHFKHMLWKCPVET